MFLSLEIDIKLSKLYKYIYIYIEFCIKVVGLNRLYSANMQRELQTMAVQYTGHVIQSEINLISISRDRNIR